jgi:hypothetical protein
VWTLRRPVIEKLIDFYLSDGVDPFSQWPAEDQRPCWEAAFEEAVEGHSKSAKVEFLGWLQARGTLQANSVTTRTPPVESPPLLEEEVGGDGALEVAPTADKEAAPKTVIIPTAAGAQYVCAATSFVNRDLHVTHTYCGGATVVALFSAWRPGRALCGRADDLAAAVLEDVEDVDPQSVFGAVALPRQRE